jgi:hypothetical protein
MTRRTPVRDLSPAPDLQPAAAPVDTYVRPAQPERSSRQASERLKLSPLTHKRKGCWSAYQRGAANTLYLE